MLAAGIELETIESRVSHSFISVLEIFYIIYQRNKKNFQSVEPL